MPRLDRTLLPGVVVALLTLVFGAACAAFVRQPGLASFADDSVSYLVMAQVLSPWQGASAAVAAAFPREAFYPPLLPLLLALTGAAHDIARAQVLQALLLAACLPLVYVLALRWLQSRWTAVGAVLLVASLPALWIQAKGVLSEPLFCLLLLALYWSCEKYAAQPWKVALPLVGLVLTRTMGLGLAAAYALWALTRLRQPLRERLRAALPAVAAGLAYGAWVLLRPSATADDNVRLLMERGLAPGTGLELAASVARQAQAIAEGWVGSLTLFWVEGQPLRVVLAGTVGLLALAGLGLRLAEGRADGWISAAYLCIFLAWPFHEQMVRFLLPLLPILILYAFEACARAARRLGRPPALAQLVLGVLLFTLTVPALAFIHQRARADVPHAAITDWYRTPDLRQARARAQVHLDLMADMALIRQLTRAEDRVMWYTPAYLALLAGRRGVASPHASLPLEQYRDRVRLAAPDYVFLSRYHPRDTVHDTAWQAGLRALSGRCKVIHARTLPDGTTVSSMILHCGRHGSA